MIGLELTDGLGRVWDLMAPRACPWAGSDFSGYGRPALDPFRSDGSPALHGSRWLGWRASEREVVLPLGFNPPRGTTVTQAVRDFARGIIPPQPGYPGTEDCKLTAILPDGTRWDLGMRLVDDGGLSVVQDPEAMRRVKYKMVWDADVFWRGPEWSASWTSATAVDPWILTSGGVAALSSSYSMSSASATNSGDVRAWPVWTLDGPFTSVSLTIGGQTVTLAYSVTAGHQVVIDTDPVVGQMAILDGAMDITSSLTAVDFAPLEPGVVTPLGITMSGTGSVSLSYRPLRLAIL